MLPTPRPFHGLHFRISVIISLDTYTTALLSTTCDLLFPIPFLMFPSPLSIFPTDTALSIVKKGAVKPTSVTRSFHSQTRVFLSTPSVLRHPIASCFLSLRESSSEVLDPPFFHIIPISCPNEFPTTRFHSSYHTTCTLVTLFIVAHSRPA